MATRPAERLLYVQNQLPVFQNRMYESAEEARACPRGDIRLVENLATGLVYNASFKPEMMIYDAHYQNEQATSEAFRTHLEEVAGIVDRCLGRSEIVEIGCGKAYFLEMLQARGFDVSGFDPTYEGDNPKVRRHYFDAKIGVRGNGLILRHVLEHVENPFDFLQQLRDANQGGKIYIEVPCFDWICTRRAWFDIFFEHVNYFRLTDFHRMFGAVVESGRLFGGQYLYVVADLASLRLPVRDPKDSIDFPGDFVEKTLGQQRGQVTQAAIWGGASKGVIFALLRARGGVPVSTVIDINPAKQGKYLPATGLLVQSPEDGLSELDKGATIFVMNSNYLHEIRTISRGAYNYIAVDCE